MAMGMTQNPPTRVRILLALSMVHGRYYIPKSIGGGFLIGWHGPRAVRNYRYGMFQDYRHGSGPSTTIDTAWPKTADMA
ncbi:hypothetical protein COCNU_06G014720 [Cocos nucifera]|uniref:Uncharacterized protein n=1 Tax=Cocos nucifera TaxID=13894 RepID=A0A8K0IC72_COCNU|nr:hypothetical protein COCNU_06G014720 [Cocos nucifera]